MKTAFIGHSHHLATRSSAFFLDLLRRLGPLETFWDKSWLDGSVLDLGPILDGSFDAVVVWQLERVAQKLAAANLPNLTFVPMYDGCHGLPNSYWSSLEDTKVLCFSSTLQGQLQRLKVRSRFIRYYPDPAQLPAVEWSEGLAAYFWQRRQDLTWPSIRQLLGTSRFKSLTLHRGSDPTYGEFVEPSAEELLRYPIRLTSWYSHPDEARLDLARHNVYFAPRLREGIGMSFLEALAMGMLVVAPDHPTMNEYVVSGVNGLLYNPTEPRALDFSRASALGRRARRSVERGHARFLRSLDNMLDFIRSPTAEVKAIAPFSSLDPLATDRAPSGRAQRKRSEPTDETRTQQGGLRFRRVNGHRKSGPLSVTVAIVTRNAHSALCPTLESVLSQDWPDREVIVLDGASSDGTVDLIREYDDKLDYWHSRPDGGPYEAMQEAADLAQGRYILYMNAGDTFHTSDSLRLALEDAPESGVIFGHHVYRHVNGYDELHQAAAFESTFSALRKGDVSWAWLAGVPGHQATLTLTSLVRRHRFRTRYRFAADHDLLYRLAAAGTQFHHVAETLATYVGGGISWKNQERCVEEWRQIALVHTDHRERVENAFESMVFGRMPVRKLASRALKERLAWTALRKRLSTAFFASTPFIRQYVTRKRLHFELRGEVSPPVRSLAGFTPAEDWGLWTDGERSVIELRDPVHRPRRITLFIREANEPNTLTFRINDAAFVRSVTGGTRRLSVKLNSHQRSPLSRIELLVKASGKPREGSESGHHRPRVALTGFEIEYRQ